ncbi:hypothetical protein [Dietzia lutea]|uniref:Uncharacterized protein n=1 Tax=Dietzia lutea TaxID=546160 RepID=A0A2S1RA39_9ACTN|nr:hypothetical protein [Dietzia lutea]AWH93160.1 hypothetical protein A6035_14340 [Dietzia lutea]
MSARPPFGPPFGRGRASLGRLLQRDHTPWPENAGQAGESALAAQAETGHVVAALISGAYPAPWEVFGGPAGLPDTA